MMRVLLAAWLCDFALARPATSQYAESPFELVTTSNGDILGHHNARKSEVWEYLGIPYARPPIGDLRFAAPQQYVANNATYNATNFGFDCPQTAAVQPAFPGLLPQALAVLHDFTAATGTQRSEDCLTLNIWSKETAKAHAKNKSVFVLFHGGRFAGGNTNSAFANGQYLAASEDIIVVSVNYRLNVFGFPGAARADTNLGLRDQRMAIEWIHSNIAAFGGNPDKIVIAGQSSGGAAVDWWSYAYKDDPLVHGFMSTSGNAFSFPMNSPAKQLSNWRNLSASLGCVDSESVDSLTCMRTKKWEDISAAVTKIPASPGGSPVRSTPPFYPMVDNEIVFSDYLSRSARGDFSKLPYFHGHNDYEQGYYVIPAFAQGRNVTEEQTAQFLLESFVCPVSYEARSRVNASVPTWVYRYFGDWNNSRLYPTSGAYHGSDLHMILGGSEDASGLPQTTEQKETVKLYQRAVAAFTEDPINGLSRELGWPRFNPEKDTWVEIAVGNGANVSFASPGKYDARCSEITMGGLTGSS